MMGFSIRTTIPSCWNEIFQDIEATEDRNEDGGNDGGGWRGDHRVLSTRSAAEDTDNIAAAAAAAAAE